MRRTLSVAVILVLAGAACSVVSGLDDFELTGSTSTGGGATCTGLGACAGTDVYAILRCNSAQDCPAGFQCCLLSM